jgi:hypothetical protein
VVYLCNATTMLIVEARCRYQAGYYDLVLQARSYRVYVLEAFVADDIKRGGTGVNGLVHAALLCEWKITESAACDSAAPYRRKHNSRLGLRFMTLFWEREGEEASFESTRTMGCILTDGQMEVARQRLAPLPPSAVAMMLATSNEFPDRRWIEDQPPDLVAAASALVTMQGSLCLEAGVASALAPHVALMGDIGRVQAIEPLLPDVTDAISFQVAIRRLPTMNVEKLDTVCRQMGIDVSPWENESAVDRPGALAREVLQAAVVHALAADQRRAQKRRNACAAGGQRGSADWATADALSDVQSTAKRQRIDGGPATWTSWLWATETAAEVQPDASRQRDGEQARPASTGWSWREFGAGVFRNAYGVLRSAAVKAAVVPVVGAGVPSAACGMVQSTAAKSAMVPDVAGRDEPPAKMEAPQLYVLVALAAVCVRRGSTLSDTVAGDKVAAMGRAAGYSGTGARGILVLEDVQVVLGTGSMVDVPERVYVLGKDTVTWTDSAEAVHAAVRRVIASWAGGGDRPAPDACAAHGPGARPGLSGVSHRSLGAIEGRLQKMHDIVQVQKRQRAREEAAASARMSEQHRRQHMQVCIQRELQAARLGNNQDVDGGCGTVDACEVLLRAAGPLVAGVMAALGVYVAGGVTGERNMSAYYAAVAPMVSAQERRRVEAVGCRMDKYLAGADQNGTPIIQRLQEFEARGLDAEERARALPELQIELRDRQDGPSVFAGVHFNAPTRASVKRYAGGVNVWYTVASYHGKLTFRKEWYSNDPRWKVDAKGLQLGRCAVQAAVVDAHALLRGDWQREFNHARELYFGGDAEAVVRLDAEWAQTTGVCAAGSGTVAVARVLLAASKIA